MTHSAEKEQLPGIAASCEFYSRASLTIQINLLQQFQILQLFSWVWINKEVWTCKARAWTGYISGKKKEIYWQSIGLEPAIGGRCEEQRLEPHYHLVSCAGHLYVCLSVEGLQGLSPDPCPGTASWNQLCFGWHQGANAWDSNTGAYEK